MDQSPRQGLREAVSGGVVAPDWADISAIARCEAALERIAQENDRIAALTDVLREAAMQEARDVDRKVADGLDAGPLAGWTVVIKDNIDTVPARCSSGLSFLQDRRPGSDAEVVSRLRRAGAVIVGVAATDSGAFGVTTPAVTNPLFPKLVAGGSSGGSAAAIAAGLCVLGVGTDTGGSVRIPAACCGVVGFKPTKGRLPMKGVRPLAPTVDHVGLLAANVKRIRHAFESIDPAGARLAIGHPPRPDQLVAGVAQGFYGDAHDSVQESMVATIVALKAMGIGIQTVDIGSPDEIVSAHVILALSDAAMAHAQDVDRVPLSSYPEIAQEGIRLGQSYSDAQRTRAVQIRDAFEAKVDRALTEVDVIVLPTLPVPPPDRDATSVSLSGRATDLLSALIRYTCAFDQTGHPVIALPAPSRNALSPASVQFVGRKNGDADLLSVAEQAEAHLKNR